MDAETAEAAGEAPDPAETETDDVAETASEVEEPEAGSAEEASDDADAEGVDEDPEEWRFLKNKFPDITDEKQLREAIGKEYLQKNQYASRVTKEKERLAKELQKLEAKLAQLDGGKAPDREAAKPPPSDPDLQRLESRIGALESQQKAFPQVEQKILTALDRARRDKAVAEYKVAAAEAQIDKADTMDQPALRAELAAIKAELRAATNDEDAQLSRYERELDGQRDIEEKLADLRTRHDYTKRLMDDERARHEHEEEERATFQEEFPKQIDTLIERFADELNVPKTNRQDMWEQVNESLMVQYWRLKDVPSDEIDHEALVRSRVQKYAERLNLSGKQKLAMLTKEKTKVAAALGTGPAAKPAAPAKRASAPSFEQETEEMLKRVSEARAALTGRPVPR